ncbi:hypothetical protein ACQ4PT_066233 [Festuca glaucescens]
MATRGGKSRKIRSRDALIDQSFIEPSPHNQPPPRRPGRGPAQRPAAPRDDDHEQSPNSMKPNNGMTHDIHTGKPPKSGSTKNRGKPTTYSICKPDDEAAGVKKEKGWQRGATTQTNADHFSSYGSLRCDLQSSTSAPSRTNTNRRSAPWTPTLPTALTRPPPPSPAPARGAQQDRQQDPEALTRIDLFCFPVPQLRVNSILRLFGLETLRRYLPVSVPEGLNELQRIAVRFEEKIYTAATSQSDYLRKVSLKMLSMETRTQQAPGNAQVIPNQNYPGQG